MADFRGANDVNVQYHGADLTDQAQIQDMIAYAASSLGTTFNDNSQMIIDPCCCHDLTLFTGPVDILVNNAGIQHVAPVEDRIRIRAPESLTAV